MPGTNYSNAFSYDGMGNRTRVENVSGGNTRVTNSTPNQLNQLSSLSHSTNGSAPTSSGFGYDVAGNTTLIESADGGKMLFTYDDAERLVRVETRNAANVSQGKSEFDYDYASRKAVSREFTWTNGAWVKTEEKRRVFDGLDVIQERNAANEVTAQLVRDGNIGGILARSTQAGATFFGYDGGGNVTLLTDSNGDDVGRYRYDAFGNTLEVSGARAAENPYRFSTKEYDAASGLYDFGFRFYSAGLGRWINRDPISEAGGVNLYQMVYNNPINAVDAYGLDAHVIWNQKTNVVDIYLPITFKYDSKTLSKRDADLAGARFQRGMEKYWSGKFKPYTVRFHVMLNSTIRIKRTGEVLENTITLVPGKSQSFCPTGNTGFWATGDDNLEYNGAHETGHLLGLDDRYSRNTGLPYPNWGNNIMGRYGKPVQARNIREIVTHTGRTETGSRVFVERR